MLLSLLSCQGHFKALYNHVRDEARKAGAAGLRLYADADNTRAHATVRPDDGLAVPTALPPLRCLLLLQVLASWIAM
jgi:hypothetical protein